jgi:hypothetical protein
MRARIEEGPIFRRLIGRDRIGEALHPGSIAPIFKRVGTVDRDAGEVCRGGQRAFDGGG